ncbi:MAG: hypothetical protein AB1489_08825 [Acidobacteriota bacterium]
MKRILIYLALLLPLLPSQVLAIGLESGAKQMDVIKYVAIFLVGCVAIFFLLIRLTIIPFLVRSYYSLADATNIGLSLFILYSLNLFTLLFFRVSATGSWRAVFIFVGVLWMIHLLLKVVLARRRED